MVPMPPQPASYLTDPFADTLTHKLPAAPPPPPAPQVDRLMAAKPQSFEQERIYRVSQAAGPLAMWVVANVAYARVLEKTAPLEAALSGLTASLEASQQRLAQCTQDLQLLDHQVRCVHHCSGIVLCVARSALLRLWVLLLRSWVHAAGLCGAVVLTLTRPINPVCVAPCGRTAAPWCSYP